MNWNYIPYSPTEGAWNTRMFQRTYGIKELIEQLHSKLPNCQGQLVFRSDNLPPPLQKKAMKAEQYYYVQYNHITELREMMEHIEWNKQKNLHKVAIYNQGYFIQ